MAIKNKYPLVINYDANDNVSGLAEVQLATSDASDIGGDTPSEGQVLTYVSADGVYQPRTPTGGGGGGAVDSVNDLTGDVSLYLSSLSGVTFDQLGGVNGDLPQHLQWNGTDWINAYEDEQYVQIRNETGSTLVKGQAVFVSASYDNDYPKVGLARADSSTTMPCIGVVYANLNDGESGLAVTFGKADIANGVSMEGSPVEGETVYVSPDTAGRLTADKPTGSTQLIQNVGIVVKEAPGQERIKVTGIGRANDIPNTITLGATTITSASAKFANVDANHILISTAASATSSIASATLFNQAITANNIATTPIAAADLENTYVSSVNGLTGNTVSLAVTNISDTDVGDVNDGDIIQYRSLGDGYVYSAVSLSEVEAYTPVTRTIGSLGNVATDADAPPEAAGDYYALTSENAGDYTPTLLDHGNVLQGLGDDDHTQYVLSAGTRSMSALTVNNEITTKDIEVTRLGQGRPTNFTWTSDYIAPQVFQNGWLQGFGTGGSIGGDSSMLNQYQDVAGIISLGVNSNSSARASMYTNNDTLYASGQAWSFTTRACMQSASVAGATYSGVIGVSNNATDYNLPSYGVYFYCGHGGGNWIARTTGQFGNTETDTGVALSSYTLSVLQIMCNEDWSKAEFYIDGSSVATHTTNLPNRVVNTGFLYKIWNNGAASAGGKMYVDWHDIKVISTSADRGEGHIKDFSDFTP